MARGLQQLPQGRRRRSGSGRSFESVEQPAQVRGDQGVPLHPVERAVPGGIVSSIRCRRVRGALGWQVRHSKRSREEPARAVASAPVTVDNNRPGARPFALTSRARRHYDVSSRLDASVKCPAHPLSTGVAWAEQGADEHGCASREQGSRRGSLGLRSGTTTIQPATVAAALAEFFRRVPVSA